jgi:hypothetical protein
MLQDQQHGEGERDHDHEASEEKGERAHLGKCRLGHDEGRGPEHDDGKLCQLRSKPRDDVDPWICVA